MRKQGRDAGNGGFLSVDEARARGDRATVETVRSELVSEAMIAAGVEVLLEFAMRSEDPKEGDARELALDVYRAMRRARR